MALSGKQQLRWNLSLCTADHGLMNRLASLRVHKHWRRAGLRRCPASPRPSAPPPHPTHLQMLPLPFHLHTRGFDLLRGTQKSWEQKLHFVSPPQGTAPSVCAARPPVAWQDLPALVHRAPFALRWSKFQNTACPFCYDFIFLFRETFLQARTHLMPSFIEKNKRNSLLTSHDPIPVYSNIYCYLLFFFFCSSHSAFSVVSQGFPAHSNWNFLSPDNCFIDYLNFFKAILTPPFICETYLDNSV